MAGPSQTRQIGYAVRIYKNRANHILAVDDIAITATVRRVKNDRFHRSGYLNSDRMYAHLGNSEDRVVYLVQMFGDYTSITADGRDFTGAQWAGQEDENDVDMSFLELGKVGDTL
jgi:hypothetical protein